MISTFDIIIIIAVLIMNSLSIRCYCKGYEIIGLILKALGDGIFLVVLCIPSI